MDGTLSGDKCCTYISSGSCDCCTRVKNSNVLTSLQETTPSLLQTWQHDSMCKTQTFFSSKHDLQFHQGRLKHSMLCRFSSDEKIWTIFHLGHLSFIPRTAKCKWRTVKALAKGGVWAELSSDKTAANPCIFKKLQRIGPLRWTANCWWYSTLYEIKHQPIIQEVNE